MQTVRHDCFCFHPLYVLVSNVKLSSITQKKEVLWHGQIKTSENPAFKAKGLL
jgi:hypothetical protein